MEKSELKLIKKENYSILNKIETKPEYFNIANKINTTDLIRTKIFNNVVSMWQTDIIGKCENYEDSKNNLKSLWAELKNVNTLKNNSYLPLNYKSSRFSRQVPKTALLTKDDIIYALERHDNFTKT